MGFSLRSSRLASVGLAGVLAVGVIGVGSVAMADEPGDSGRSGEHRDHGHRPIKFGIQALLKDSGVTREEIQEGAAAGKTLGQIIDEYGDISAEQAKANALAALDARLAELVAGGDLTQEEADRIEAKAPEAFDRLLGAVPGQHGDRPGHGRGFAIAKHSLETVAEVLGIDVATLRTQLGEGQTVAEIAGPQTQAVIDALVADAGEAIDNAVANGRLPEDKADEAKTKAAEFIEKWVNEGRPERPEGAEGRVRPGLRGR